MMMWSILFLFLDLLFHTLLAQQMSNFLLAYAIVSFLQVVKTPWDKLFVWLGPLLVLTIYHTFLYNHAGLTLVYMLPIFALIWYISRVIITPRPVLSFLPMVIIFSVLVQDTVILPVVLGYKCIYWMTLIRIFVTIIQGYLVFLGLWSSRSIGVFSSNERKVWTLNRKDAS